MCVQPRSALGKRELLLDAFCCEKDAVVGRQHEHATIFAGSLSARARRTATASAQAGVSQAVMTVDREREGSGVPMNNGGRPTKRVR